MSALRRCLALSAPPGDTAHVMPKTVVSGPPGLSVLYKTPLVTVVVAGYYPGMPGGQTQCRQNGPDRVFAEFGRDALTGKHRKLPATAKNESEAAYQDPLPTGAALGARGLPRPQVQAAVLSRISGGQLPRVGPALLQLQRQYGNRYVQQVVRQVHQSRPVGPAGLSVLRPKLVLGAAHNRSEREADRVAHQVAGQPVLRRRAEAQAAASSQDVERAYGAVGGALDAGTRQAVRQAAAGGQPIQELVRATMEWALGADFSRVKIHTGHHADQLNRSFQACAFTIGQHVFFRHGGYDPGSPAGRALLAHELTHVVQQQPGALAAGRTSDGGSGASLIQRDFRPEHDFPGRDQKKVGVGETVKLSIKPAIAKAHTSRLEWVELTPRPAGVLGVTKPTGDADFVAGERQGTAILSCRHMYTKQQLHLDRVEIVEPDGGHMRQAPGTQIRHIPSGWNVSFVGNQFLHPQDVSFHKIEFMEGAASAQYHPSRADWKVSNQRDHPAGPWVDVHPARNSADGSQCGGDDWVSSGFHSDLSPRPHGNPATMTWRIPWLWKPAGMAVAGRQFTTVDHVAYDYGSGRARLTKGGVDVSADAAHPAQWFYPNLDENIAQIKGYYQSKHAAGYGAPWHVIEGRLRAFGNIGPLADLLAAVREGTWDDPTTVLPGTHGLFQHLTLNQLIDEAAHLWGLQVPPP